MSNLPPELITDIFTRLPVKSVLRFRCLSKPWCSQIDSQSFKKAHLAQSLKTGANLHVLLGYLGIRAVDLDRPDRATDLRPPFSASDFTTSINGVVLVLTDATPFLWNPFTRKFHQLPSPPAEKYASDVGSVFEKFGFSYDSGTDDYVVVRVVELRDKYHKCTRCEAMIYSCNSGTWRKTCNFPYTLPYKRVWGVHLNGVLHTATYGGIKNPEWFINGFDVRNEKHLVLPKPRITGPDAEFSVEVMGGYLCLVRLRWADRTDIWMMKEYGVKESWTMLLSLAPPAVVETYYSLCPLAFSKDGQEVLLNFDDQRLIWYHLKRKSVRNEAVAGLPSLFYADVCVASLIHPGPQVAGQPQHNQEGKTLVGRKSSKKRDLSWYYDG